MRVSVTTASGISFSSTSSLFNSSVPFSLTNPDPVSALTWFSAESGLTTDLAQRFELTSAQFNALLSWRNRTKAELFNQLIAAYYKLNDVSSIGLAQWGEANITQQSVRDLLPSLQLPMAPEYALWSQCKKKTLKFSFYFFKKQKQIKQSNFFKIIIQFLFQFLLNYFMDLFLFLNLTFS